MAKSEFSQYASKVDQPWETSNEFGEVPDGRFVALIEKAQVKKSKKGYWMLSVQFRVKDDPENGGENVNRCCFASMSFESDKGWNPYRVKEFFEALDLQLPEMGQMEDALDELVEQKIYVALEVVTKNDFTNCNVEEVVEFQEEEEASAKGKKAGKKAVGKGTTAGAKREEEPAPEAQDDLPSEDDVNGWEKDEVLAFAEENEITLESKILKKAKDQILAWISEKKKAQKPAGKKAEGKATGKASSKKEEPQEDLFQKLKDFCDSVGVDLVEQIGKKGTLEDAQELFKEEYQFEEADLSDEDVALLEKLDLAQCIIKPEPARGKKPVAKKK